MPVELITERLLIQPNRVFIIPEQRDLHVLDGEFRLKPISKPRGWPDGRSSSSSGHRREVFNGNPKGLSNSKAVVVRDRRFERQQTSCKASQ
jgi:hypothetical protein